MSETNHQNSNEIIKLIITIIAIIFLIIIVTNSTKMLKKPVNVTIAEARLIIL